MKTKLGKMKLEHLMRVQQLEVGDKTYMFPNQPELPAGQYELWLNGNNVEFVKVIDSVEEAKATMNSMLHNLRERGEHQ